MKTFRTTAQFAILVTLSSQAQADWTANLGFASGYYYRGIFQGTSKTKGPKKRALQFLARPERLIPRYARHPFGAHFVRLSSRFALLGANAALRAA